MVSRSERRALRSRRRRLIAAAVALLLLVVLLVQFIRRGPRLVTTRGGGGQLCMLSREQLAFVSDLQNYLDSPEFLADLEAALPEERELIQAWRTGKYRVSVDEDGRASYYADCWTVKVNYLLGDVMWVSGSPPPDSEDEEMWLALHGEDVLAAAREAGERTRRLRATMTELIRAKLQILMLGAPSSR